MHGLLQRGMPFGSSTNLPMVLGVMDSGIQETKVRMAELRTLGTRFSLGDFGLDKARSRNQPNEHLQGVQIQWQAV